MSNPYTIEKTQIPADVYLPNQAPTALRFFLDPNPRNSTGHDRPSMIFEHDSPFVPMLNDADEIVFVRRESIMALTVPSASELDEEEEAMEGFGTEQTRSAEIEVKLEDGTVLQGEVRYLLPEGNNRLQDFIDRTAYHIILRAGSEVHVVNKQKVMTVRPTREQEGAR